MSDLVKIAIVLCCTVIVIFIVWMYFSPYQTCLRAERAEDSSNAEIRCAVAVSGGLRR